MIPTRYVDAWSEGAPFEYFTRGDVEAALAIADIPPSVVVIALTPRETLRAVKRCYPIARDVALGVVLRDGLGFAERLVEFARRCK